MVSLDSVSISWTRTRVHPARLLTTAGAPPLRDEAAYAVAWSTAPLGLVPGWRPPWDQARAFSVAARGRVGATQQDQPAVE